jgi:hypothetical protein
VQHPRVVLPARAQHDQLSVQHAVTLSQPGVRAPLSFRAFRGSGNPRA